MREFCGLKGRYEIRRNGSLIRSGHNLIVTDGKELLALLLSGGGTAPTHMAMGSSGNAAAASQTALQGTEHERVAFDSAVQSEQTCTFVGTFGSGLGGNVSVEEFGVFNAASVGTMLARFVASQFTALPTDTIEVTWALEFD